MKRSHSLEIIGVQSKNTEVPNNTCNDHSGTHFGIIEKLNIMVDLKDLRLVTFFISGNVTIGILPCDCILDQWHQRHGSIP